MSVAPASANGTPDHTPRRTPQQARSRARLALVLQASEQILTEEGVEALTTTRVATVAGVSVGSLYQYLPDRGAIIDALADKYLAHFEAVMDGFVANAAARRWNDPVGMLVDGFVAVLRDAHAFRALWLDSGVTEQSRAADRAHKRRMADGVRRTLLVLDLAADHPDLVVACEVAVLAADAVLKEAFRRDPAGEPSLITETKVILRGYLADISARPHR